MGELLLHVPFLDSINAIFAKGDPNGIIDPKGTEPRSEDDGVRKGMHFGENTCVHYRVEKKLQPPGGYGNAVV